MKKNIVKILKYVLFLGLGVFLVWWSLHQIPKNRWSEFKQAFSTARYWLFVPVFFVLLFSHWLRAVRWRMLMEPLGYKPSLTNTFLAVMVGYLANLAVPRLGEVLKCTILAKYEHVPADKLIGTIVAERAFDLLCLVTVFVLAFLLQYDEISQFGFGMVRQFASDRQGTPDFTTIAVIVAIVAIIAIAIKLLYKRFASYPAVVAAGHMVKGIWHGIISVKDLKQKWPFIFSSLGIWLMYLLGTWLGFHATEGTSDLPFEAAVSSLAFASVGMILTPGGIGAYAFFLAEVLQQNGIPFEIGFANGTLQWFAQFIIILFVGFVSLILLPYYNKKHRKHEKA